MRVVLPKLWCAIVALGATASVMAASAPEAPGTIKRFIACPVYRDTSNLRKSGCWLTPEPETGNRYDVWYAINRPIIGRELLVEGAVSNETDMCGGVVLKPVRISVLANSCPEALVPAEGYPSRRYVTTGTVMAQKFQPQKMPQPPYTSQSYTIYFDYNDDLLMYQYAETILIDAARLALAGKAQSVTITGHAMVTGYQASGRLLQEPLRLAEARAQMAAEALRRLGVPAALIATHATGDAAPDPAAPAAFAEASRRRVTIAVAIP